MKIKINFFIYVVAIASILGTSKNYTTTYTEHGNNLWATGRVSTDFGRDRRIMPSRTYGHFPMDTDRWDNRQWFSVDDQDYNDPGCTRGNCF